MKKMLLGFIPLVMLIMACAGGAAPAASPGGISLDEAIAEASERMEARLNAGTKVALISFSSSSAQFSEYVLEGVSLQLVNGGKLIVVDRANLDRVRQEQGFQLSGDVSDESAKAMGQMLGADAIVTGSLTNIGQIYRINLKAISVEAATVLVQYAGDIVSDERVNALLASGGGSGGTAAAARPASGGTQTAAAPAQATTPAQAAAPAASQPAVNEPPITGTPVPGDSLTEKLAWLDRSADSNNTYILEVKADESIAPHVFDFGNAINITVVLRGDDINRTIRLRSNGNMFYVKENVTFILDNNITLQGHNGNTGAMVCVYGGGTFKMRTGSAITGNTCREDGGGVSVHGTFEMTGGTISDNTSTSNFRGGGGVYIQGTFTMNGGVISGNTARSGGGVYLANTNFIMRGGTITGNTAREAGGGVRCWNSDTFTKSGGTITGYSSDPDNGNAVRDMAGNVIARNGHAVWVNENYRKESTAGPGLSLSTNSNIGWD